MGERFTPQGHRSTSTHLGQTLWAAATAMAALDRVAAAFAALYLPVKPNGDLYDFGNLSDNRANRKPLPEPMRDWIQAVRKDRRYADLVEPARPTIVHRTTGRALEVSIGLGAGGGIKYSEGFILPSGGSVSARRLTAEGITLCRDRVLEAIAILEADPKVKDGPERP